MRKIYVVNKSGHDFSSVKEYGDKVIYLTEGEIPRLKTNKIYRLICNRMWDSQPEDWIVQTGLTIINMIACAVFARKHGKLNLLIYRKKLNSPAGRYVARNLNIDELLGSYDIVEDSDES